MGVEFLEQIRMFELEKIFSRIIGQRNPQSVILDIGAGAGWQARELSNRGYKVHAIDIDSSAYFRYSVYPVSVYDGHRIPFPDNYFDIIYASHVMTTIPKTKVFHYETRRVLKNDGICIHIVPTVCWRLWTNFKYYPELVKNVIKKRAGQKNSNLILKDLNGEVRDTKKIVNFRLFFQSIARNILPSRLGQKGNCLSEMYYFSRLGWRKNFENAGWKIVSRFPSKLFYSGYSLLGPALPIPTRKSLSCVLGSGSNVFVLAKHVDNDYHSNLDLRTRQTDGTHNMPTHCQ